MVTVDGDDDDDDDDDGNCRLAERLVSMYKLRSQRSNGILETPQKKKRGESKEDTEREGGKKTRRRQGTAGNAPVQHSAEDCGGTACSQSLRD